MGYNRFNVETNIVDKILECCKRLHQKDMLAAGDGNLSYRVDDNRILVTPSGYSKAFITPEMMTEVNLNGDILKGKPSSEVKMHLEVYRSTPKAKCVVHAHPPYAVSWSVAHPEMKELPGDALAEVILTTGRIPIANYATPGSQELAQSVRDLVPYHRVMILARHGALSWGEDLDEAYNGMERIEHASKILHYALTLGAITKLPDDEIAKLKEIRSTLGPKTL